jgi:predicted MFS family arabinose efflux permease
MLIVNTSLAFFVLKGDPDDLGEKPLGYQPGGTTGGEEDRASTSETPQDLNLREAMQTRSFWLFLITMFICGSGDFLVTTHLIPMVTDHGISPFTAGNMLAWLGLMSLAGILVVGPVSDLIGNKIPIALTFLLRCLLFLLILEYQSVWSFYLFSLGFGFTLLITAPLNATLMGRLYGLSHLGLISGFITTIHHLGGGFWAYMGGLIFDQTASYRLAFVFSTIMAVVAIFSTALIAEKKHQVVVRC